MKWTSTIATLLGKGNIKEINPTSTYQRATKLGGVSGCIIISVLWRIVYHSVGTIGADEIRGTKSSLDGI